MPQIIPILDQTYRSRMYYSTSSFSLAEDSANWFIITLDSEDEFNKNSKRLLSFYSFLEMTVKNFRSDKTESNWYVITILFTWFAQIFLCIHFYCLLINIYAYNVRFLRGNDNWMVLRSLHKTFLFNSKDFWTKNKYSKSKIFLCFRFNISFHFAMAAML